ncbi:hypothetical protein SeLEV6574_g07620 [Synchytrium endobioticum]|uniref:Uncharacterized protein n=1 Tax=Synchytrium endobioticum TaxID=286115 RepID=A0A507CLC1_9FUNG|nr:hypothetical protein SeLEV6574_g07620 [Synchytrium endobioticum]
MAFNTRNGPQRRLLHARSRATFDRHFETLTRILKQYLSLEVKYAIALGIVAPHLLTILNPEDEASHGTERDAAINELRAERGRVAKLIDEIRANPTSVSLIDAADHSVLPLKLHNNPRLSPQELSMAPTSHMSVARLHYVMEYNALLWMKYRFKFGQLTSVLAYLPRNSPYRQNLETQQTQTHVLIETYLGRASWYAKELVEMALHSGFGYAKASSHSLSLYGIGNESHNPEPTVPAAFPQPVDPGYLDFDGDLYPDNRNTGLQQLEESDGESSFPVLEDIVEIPPMPYEAESPGSTQPFLYQKYPSPVDFQALAEPPYFDLYPQIGPDIVYESSPGFEAYGSNENPHHVDLGLSHRNEAEVMRSASVHRHMTYADEAGSSSHGDLY